MQRSSFRGGMAFGLNDHAAPMDVVRFTDNMLPDPLGALSTRDGRTRRQDQTIGDVVYDAFRFLGSDSSYRDMIAYRNPNTNSGTAQAGAASTITLASAASTTDDFYNGQKITLTGGTGSGQDAWITDYVGSTRVATVDSAWSVTPDATTTYTVASSMIYGHADGTGDINEIYGGLTDGNPVIGVQKKFRLFLNNGEDDTRLYLFDSTLQSRAVGLGVGPDLSSLTPTEPGSGDIDDGTYKYRITALYGDDGESNPGLASNTVTTTGGSSNIVIPTWSHPTEPIGLTRTGYKIWRNDGDQTTVSSIDIYRFVAEVTASTTSYTDTLANATRNGNELMEPNHNSPPTKLTGMASWDYEDILVAWGEKATVDSTVYPNRLFFSEQGQPEVWKTENSDIELANTAEFQDVPQTSDDNPIIAGIAAGPFFYVFNRKGVRVLTPTNVARAYKVDVVSNSEDHGIIGPKAVAATDSGEIYYVSTDGLRRIVGRIDEQVSPDTDSASRGLVARGGVGNVGESLNTIIHSIPPSLYKQVRAHEFRDRIHISMATSAISMTTPTMNNDVLIYDIATGGFSYSTDRNVYGWMTINDSGNDYRLVSCGYSTPISAPTTTLGNFWNEYVSGTETDEDAEGNTSDVSWKIVDYNRGVPGFKVAKLVDLMIDAAASSTTIAAKITLDADRSSTTKNFTYTTAGQTAWQDFSYWQSDPANDLSGDAGFGDGTAMTALVALFTAISDGKLRAVVDSTNYDVDDGDAMDFTSDTTIDEIVATLNAGLDAVSCPAHFDFVKSPGYFRLTHDDPGSGNSVTDVAAAPGAGTDLATAALLGTGSSEIVSQSVAVPSPFVGLTWWDTAITALTQHFWSSGLAVRGAPKRALFHGERGQMISVELSGTSPATIYGYIINYHALSQSLDGAS